jgi:hypothetical protein
MQSNDAALDMISAAAERSGGKDASTAEEVRDVFEALWKEREAEMARWDIPPEHRPLHEQGDRLRNLGLAEYLLEWRADLSMVKDVILRDVAAELEPERLKSSRDPGRRKAALERFRDRLEGKPVDLEAVDESNTPLLVKMNEAASRGEEGLINVDIPLRRAGGPAGHDVEEV